MEPPQIFPPQPPPHLKVESKFGEHFLLQSHHLRVELMTLLARVCCCHPKHLHFGEGMNPVVEWVGSRMETIYSYITNLHPSHIPASLYPP